MFKRALCFLFFIVAIFGCSSDNNNTPTTPPPPAVQAPTISGMAPDHVVAGQQGVGGAITGTNFSGNITVDLGPGVNLTEAAVANSTTINIKFSVNSTAAGGSRTIRVTNQAGTATSGKIFTVDGRSPHADFSVQSVKSDLSTFRFNASGSSTSTGKLDKFLWDFGDRTKTEGKIVEHKYTKDGNFSVQLTVVNTFGLKDDSSKKVDVKTDTGGGGGGGGGGGCNQPFIIDSDSPTGTSCFGFGAIQKFTIVAVNFPNITSDHPLHGCGSGRPEIRRQNTGGLKEYLGDVKAFSCGGRVVTLRVYGLPNYIPPRVGEKVYLVFK